jgi:2-polyprenyl-6-methoxyphenol hydroxylase-like FAD-dependent oxidoreductase
MQRFTGAGDPVANALVVGGGLGGIAAAIALEQVGLDVSVYEQAGATRREGHTITLWSNGTAALAALGVSPLKMQVIDRMLLHDGMGRELLDLNVAAVAERHGHPSINIWRHDLLAALMNSFRGPIHFGKRCVMVEQQAASSVARFADGTTAHAALVVVADGAHSTVRSALWGDHSSYAGTTCWVGTLDGHSTDVQPHTVSAVATASTYGMQFPMPEGRMHWFVDTRQPVAPDATDTRAIKTISRSWPQPFAALAAATKPDDLTQIPIYIRRPPRRWFVGRTVLLGDSAHAMGPALGQGGSQAFLDAVALRDAVSDCSTIDSAVRRYQKRRAGTVLRLWIGSNLTLKLRRTGVMETLTRFTPHTLASRSFARSIRPARRP